MKTSLFSLVRSTFPQVMFAAYVHEMRRQLADCRTCLDIGCGANSPVRFLGFDYSVGIEGYPPLLEAAKQNKSHSEHLLCDAREIAGRFKPGQFDCCVALDLIEHLSKEDGLRFLRDMEAIASKKVLLFTPNGFLPQASTEGDLQEHLSGWEPAEMRALGYQVLGMHGHRLLRGELHEHRIRPRSLSGIASLTTHVLYTRSHPESAAALLCVKQH